MVSHNVEISVYRTRAHKWAFGVLSVLMLSCPFLEGPEAYWESNPIWSPNGDYIAFECYYGKPDWEGFYPDTGYEICVVGLDGEKSYIRLTTNDRFDHSPSWSPDSKRIVFASRGFSGKVFTEKIMMIDPDGDNLVELTAGQGSPVWSPSGQYVAYQDITGSLALIDVETGQANTLSSAGNKGDDFDLVWSPDGQQLAFTSTRNGHAEIYVINADGSGERRLTYGSSDSEDPAWSPDSKQLAFLSLKDSQPEKPGLGDWAVDMIEADGSNRVELTRMMADIVWARDSQYILLVSRVSDGIFMINLANHTQTQLSTIPRQGGLSFSPDGQRVAVIRYETDFDDATSRIWIVNLDNSEEFKLTQH